MKSALPTPDVPSSIELLQRYCDGDAFAADEIFERYAQRLTALARARLSARLASRTEPEDVVMSAWRSFFVGAREGRFALSRSGDLWRLLVEITLHKLYRQARRHTAARRTVSAEQPAETLDIAHLVSAGPTPDEALALADELEAILTDLGTFERRLLELRLQGERLEDIGAELACSERTVRRTMALLRRRLAARLESADGE